jgi:hypothetical protein
MDEQTENVISWEPYVWRGALGGAVSAVAVVLVGAIYVWLRVGAANLAEHFVVAGVFGLIGGGITGLAVGFVIFKTTSRTGTQPNHAMRIVIGVGCVLALDLIGLISGSLHPEFVVCWAVAVGGLPGLMARAPTTSAATSVSASSA